MDRIFNEDEPVKKCPTCGAEITGISEVFDADGKKISTNEYSYGNSPVNEKEHKFALKEDIDKTILDNEQELIAKELKNSGKSEDIAKKISIGKLNKFKEENALMSQAWVMEPKKKVQEIFKSINISDLIIKEFYRIKVGE